MSLGLNRLLRGGHADTTTVATPAAQGAAPVRGGHNPQQLHQAQSVPPRQGGGSVANSAQPGQRPNALHQGSVTGGARRSRFKSFKSLFTRGRAAAGHQNHNDIALRTLAHAAPQAAHAAPLAGEQEMPRLGIMARRPQVNIAPQAANAAPVADEQEVPPARPGVITQRPQVNIAPQAANAAPVADEQEVPPAKPFHIDIDNEGQAQITAPTAQQAMQKLLNQTLGHPNMRYLGSLSAADNHQHALLDTQGKWLSLHLSDDGLLAVANSKVNPQRYDIAQAEALRPRMSANGQYVSAGVDGNRQTVRLPDSALRAHLSGVVHQRMQSGAQALCLHDDKLYQRDGDNPWKVHSLALPGEATGKQSLLERQENGQHTLVQDDHYLVDLANNQHSARIDNKITAASQAQDGSVLLLTSNKETKAQHLLRLPGITSDAGQIELQIKSNNLSLASICQHGDKLFAASHTGKLMVASRPTNDDVLVPLLADAPEVNFDDHDRLQQRMETEIRNVVGADFTVESFIQGETNRQPNEHESHLLHVVVKDRANQKHAIGFEWRDNPNEMEFKSAWNLSDSLVLTQQEGLSKPKPTDDNKLDLGLQGQLMLHDGKVQYRDNNSLRWQASEVEADQLRVGKDGQAWALKDNRFFRLKVKSASEDIAFKNNVFALPQLKRSVSEDVAQAGLDRTQNTVAASALEDGRYVTLSDSGDVHFHQVDSTTRYDKRPTVTLNHDDVTREMQALLRSDHPERQQEGAGVKVCDMAIGPGDDLFLVTDKGHLFRLPAAGWQSGNVDEMSLETPDDEPSGAQGREIHALALHTGTKDGLVVKRDDKQLAILSDGKWIVKKEASSDQQEVHSNTAEEHSNTAEVHSNTAEEHSNTAEEHSNAAEEHSNTGEEHSNAAEVHSNTAEEHSNAAEVHYASLKQPLKEIRLGKSNLTLRVDVNGLGMQTHPRHKVSTSLRQRFSAYIFRSTLSMPRPIKILDYKIQHTHSGRAGLNDLYQAQSQLLSDFNAAHARTQGPASVGPANSLEARLTSLSASANSPDWVKTLPLFGQQVAESAGHHAQLLNQHYGQRNGTLHKRASRVTEQLNPARNSDEDLTPKLHHLMTRFPAGYDNSAKQALQELKDQGTRLTYQKNQDAIPLGMKRDRHDDMGLTKAGLMLDMVTLQKMHALVDNIEQALSLPQGTEDEAKARDERLNGLKEQFNQLRTEQWGDNIIHQTTHHGFTNISGLEANYDAIKAMTKAFSKPHHGLNLMAREVMQAKNQQELERELQDTLMTLGKGESITFKRTYGISSTLSGTPGDQVIAGVGGKGNFDRSYSMTFTRAEGGVTVSFGRDGSLGAAVFSGIGYNVLKDVNKPDLDDKHQLSGTLRAGGVLSAPLQRLRQNKLSFDLSDREIPQMVQGLTAGNLNPLELMQRGMNHNVSKGNTLSFDIDASAVVLAMASFPLTDNSEKGKPASARLGLGIVGGVNVLSGQRDRETSHKAEESGVSRSNNRVRGLNKANAEVSFSVPIGVVATGASGRMPVMGGPGVRAEVSVDNRTKHNISLSMKPARPLQLAHLDEFHKKLEKAFKDPASAAVFNDIKTGDYSVDDQLQLLAIHFSFYNQSTCDNKQSKLLRELADHQRTQQAAAKGEQILESAEYKTTYANLNKVTSAGLVSQISHILNSKLSPGHAENINALLDQDPRLQSLITGLQDNISTEATITLELKDAAKTKLEEDLLNGAIDQKGITQRMLKRDDLRLKSIDFSKSRSKEDGFATPSFLLAGSNGASVSMKQILGKISFSYGEDQVNPTHYSLEGRAAKTSEQLIDALREAQREGWALKS